MSTEPESGGELDRMLQDRTRALPYSALKDLAASLTDLENWILECLRHRGSESEAQEFEKLMGQRRWVRTHVRAYPESYPGIPMSHAASGG